MEPRPKLKRPLDADSSGLTSKRRSPCSSTTTLEISTTEEDAIKEFQNFLREQRRGWPSEFHDRAVSVALAQVAKIMSYHIFSLFQLVKLMTRLSRT